MAESTSWVEILVEDDGPGIPEEQMANLFKPFYSTSTKGNGLGLATSRKIAKAMHGDLYLVPSNSGAIFAIRLPRE
jgi:signal transduction histidine kinase